MAREANPRKKNTINSYRIIFYDLYSIKFIAIIFENYSKKSTFSKMLFAFDDLFESLHSETP